MYFLDGQLAQQIVERTMNIIGYNINVMNNHGVILGSGESKRINTIHEGALLAISQQRTVIIDDGTMLNLKGVKSGINQPLYYRGQIVGALGITGKPDEVKQMASLLKMTAEMMIEQADLIERSNLQKRQKEELILQLIKPHKQAQMQQWAAQLNIDLTIPRVAAIIELQANEQQSAQQQLQQIIHLLENPARDNLVAMTSINQLVILKPALLNGKEWDPSLEESRIDKLFSRIAPTAGIKLSIALGHYFVGLEGIARSYQTALDTLALGKFHAPTQYKYLYKDYAMPVLLSELSHHWRGDELKAPLLALKNKDKNGQLQKTLTAYLNHFDDMGKCADSLFIHRNTLRYRLDRISVITQLDMHNINDLLQLHLAQTLCHTSAINDLG